MYSPGLGQRDVEIRMPLSPEISQYVLAGLTMLEAILGFRNDEVDDWNRMTYGHSHEYFHF
jgi:hypothetical protein